ncbi:MAG: DUF1194 domain-containing protein [Pseudomonadota bacterium]
MKRLAACLISILALAPVPATAFCKLALAFALDVSSSVNDGEYRIQLHGLADALASEEVQTAILSPEGAHIMAAAYEWSGYRQQTLLMDWTKLDTPGAISLFANRLRQTRRRYSEYPTALGKAVQYGAQLLRRAPPCARQVLDISGDGENNVGVGPEYFRRQGVLDGLIINGLVIQGAFPDPAIYYKRHVIQGPNAFMALARDFDDYPDVMLGKLLREIEGDLIIGRVVR